MHKKTIIISVITYGFSSWGGGVDFIRHMLSFLEDAQKINCVVSKSLILPKNDFFEFFKKFLYPFRNLIKQILKNEKISWNLKPGYANDYLMRTFSEFQKNTKITYSKPSFKSQLNAAIKSGATVVLPCIDVPPKSFKLPWIGYIADFQHLHFPEYFSDEAVKVRNKKYGRMLNQAKHIIVYGNAVINDANKFFPGYTAKIHALPFCPCPQKEWLINDLDVREKYNVEKPYFLISNQFWIHKDHATAFRAFAKYSKQGGEAMLICTGEVFDHRFPGYFSEILAQLNTLGISHKIKILGHIPKIDQIALMKKSIAIIQPTLFEGGPGGGAAYDAVSLGIPVIASDIEINKEMNCGDVTFFEARNCDDLCSKMHNREVIGLIPQSNEVLWREGLTRREFISKHLIDIICEAEAESNSTQT